MACIPPYKSCITKPDRYTFGVSFFLGLGLANWFDLESQVEVMVHTINTTTKGKVEQHNRL